MTGSIGYYYFDNEKGFRVVCLDINYSWNTSKSIWEHNRENSYGPPSENIKGDSLGPVQLSWLEDVLTDAAQKGISCIVTAHTSISGTSSDRFSRRRGHKSNFQKGQQHTS